MPARRLQTLVQHNSVIYITAWSEDTNVEREIKDSLTEAYLASGCKASDTAFVHSSSLGVSLKKKASLLRSSSWKLQRRTKEFFLSFFFFKRFILIHTSYFYSLPKTGSTFKQQSVKGFQNEWARSAERVGGNVLLFKTGLMLPKVPAVHARLCDRIMGRTSELRRIERKSMKSNRTHPTQYMSGGRSVHWSHGLRHSLGVWPLTL